MFFHISKKGVPDVRRTRATRKRRKEKKEQIYNESNGGLAIYGQGLYSTTSKQYAQKFGQVRLVDYDGLSANPLPLKNALSFSYSEQLIRQKLQHFSKPFLQRRSWSYGANSKTWL